MTAAGIVLFMLGASAMDSPSLVIPTALIATGIMLIGLGWRKSRWTTSAE